MNLKHAPAFSASELGNRLERLFSGVFSDDLEHAYLHVNELCLHLCFRIARHCHLLRRPATPLDQLLAEANIATDASYLIETVLQILCEEGFAKSTPAGFECLLECPSDQSNRLQLQARAACPDAIPIFELIGRCHEHAIDFVTGKKTGLATVFARGDVGLWQRVHSVDKVMSIYADMVAPVFKAVMQPGMRVIEVGGGVGAVLQRCAPMLDQFRLDHYCFTDLGQSFVQAAQRAYGDDRRLSFAIVDLDLPLRDQGLVPESFDAVIAVNVLHAVKRLRFSLRELHRLLKPNGYLILSECSPPDRFRRWRLDVVFGFLRGWWNVSAEPPWRLRPGFLLPGQWQEALLECHYDSVELLPGEDWFRGTCRGGVILAQKKHAEPS
jgi:SAM-dependent methyltransferase